MEKSQPGRPKMLFYGESPVCTSGVGRLHDMLVREFAKDFDITMIAVDHPNFVIRSGSVFVEYDNKKYPIMLTAPYEGDSEGARLFAQALQREKFDVIFTSRDFQHQMRVFKFIDEARRTTGAKWVSYFPIDRSTVMDVETQFYSLPDASICISQFGRNQLVALDKKLTDKIKVIWHPVRFEDFPLMSAAECKEFRDKSYPHFTNKDYIILSVNRNIPRKDIPRALQIFAKFNKQNKKAKLYLHCKPEDVGGDLRINAKELGIDPHEYLTSAQKTVKSALPQNILNSIYQSCNLLISTSRGEGFGYSTAEAMATKLPVLVPRNTAFIDLVGENEERGYFIDADELICDFGSGNVYRHLSSIESGLKQLNHIYAHQDEAKAKAEAAYKWAVDNLSLSIISKQWQGLFKKLGVLNQR